MAMVEAAELRKSERLFDPEDEYFGDFAGLAMASCTFYMCQRCENPYFGGMIDCRQALRDEMSINKEDLRCQPCTSEELGIGQKECNKPGHGKGFIDYKCRFCCNIATYICFNGTHMCHSCHLKAFNQTLNFHRHKNEIKCSKNAEGKCPLGIIDHV